MDYVSERKNELNEKISNDRSRLALLTRNGYCPTRSERKEIQLLKQRISINTGKLFQYQNPQFANEEVSYRLKQKR